ncbi:MAG TPA: cell division protein ZapA, partial [Nitrosomonas sp.]|nr:cell division protein ZapA [Nitrosomonas sp.]
MGREFSISCPDEEREEILKAAEFLNSKIQEIRNEGKIIDSERV